MEENEKTGGANVLDALSPETQRQIYAEMLANQKKHLEEIAALKAKLANQEKALDMIATEGIDIRLVSPIEEVAPYLGFDHPEELKVLLEVDDAEYLKRVFRRFTTLQSQFRRGLEDKQLDIDGNAFYDKFKQVYDFMKLHPNTETFSTKDIDEYIATVRTFNDAFAMLLEWQKLHADMGTVDEATANLTMHYAIRQMRQQAKTEMNKVAVNYEKEMEKFAPPENGEKDAVEATPEGESAPENAPVEAQTADDEIPKLTYRKAKK